MKDTTPKDTTKASEGHAETKAHAPSSPLLDKKSSFGWARALLIAIPLALVGMFIVFSSFAATASQTYVIGLYEGMLGRKNVSANDSGVKFWAGQIDSGKATKAAVYTAIYNTNEAKAWREKLVKAGYGTANYTPPGTSTTSSSKIKDTNTPQAVQKTTTQLTKCKKTTTECVTEIYISVLGRKPDSKGLAYFVSQVDNKKRTLADVYSALKYSKEKAVATAPTGTKSTKPPSNTRATVSAKQCKDRIDKQFPGDLGDSGWKDRGDAAKRVGWKVGDAYLRYTGSYSGYRKPYSGPGYQYSSEFSSGGFSAEGKVWIDKIVNCEVTWNQFVETIKNSADAKKWSDSKKDFSEQYEKPVAQAYGSILKAAIAAKGGSYTCWYSDPKGDVRDWFTIPEYANKVPPYQCFSDLGLPKPLSAQGGADLPSLIAAGGVSIDDAISAINGGAAGFCQAGSDPSSAFPVPGSTDDLPSCQGGGSFYTQTDVTTAASQPRAATGEDSAPPLQGQSGTNSVDY